MIYHDHDHDHDDDDHHQHRDITMIIYPNTIIPLIQSTILKRPHSFRHPQASPEKWSAAAIIG